MSEQKLAAALINISKATEVARLLTYKKICEKCESQFISRKTFAKYCSPRCKEKKRRHGICIICSNPTKARNSATCSLSCRRELFAKKPRRSKHKECAECGRVFYFYPSQNRKFCSYKCHLSSGGALRAGIASARMRKTSSGAKKDANHMEIVRAFKKLGAEIIDLSPLGYGVPDILVAVRRSAYLVEIKNPKTKYGRTGGNALQIAWAASWPCPVYIVESIDDVLALANGHYEKLRTIVPGAHTVGEAVAAIVGTRT